MTLSAAFAACPAYVEFQAVIESGVSTATPGRAEFITPMKFKMLQFLIALAAKKLQNPRALHMAKSTLTQTSRDGYTFQEAWKI